MHFSWRIQDPARTPERKKNVNQLRFVRSCPFPSNLTKLSFVRSPRCVVPSRKAAATARIGEVWYYIKLCGATRGFARRKLPGWGCSVKEIESFFPPVPVLVSATEHRSFDFGETVMRDETRSGEGRGGEGRGGRIPRDRFEGKCGRGKRGKLEGRIARSRTKISFRFLALDGSNGFSYSRRMRRRGSKRAVGIYSLGRNGFRFPSRHVSSNISSFNISFIFTRDDLRNNL